MNIFKRCPHCNAKLQAKDFNLDVEGKCPFCDTELFNFEDKAFVRVLKEALLKEGASILTRNNELLEYVIASLNSDSEKVQILKKLCEINLISSFFDFQEICEKHGKFEYVGKIAYNANVEDEIETKLRGLKTDDGRYEDVMLLVFLALGIDPILPEFEIVNSRLIRYNGHDADVIIPDGVKAINGGAFENCDFISSVVIPDSVIFILENAFCGCEKLTSVEIPKSVEYIHPSAFNFCSRLVEIVNLSSININVDDVYNKNLELYNIESEFETEFKNRYEDELNNKKRISEDALSDLYANEDEFAHKFDKHDSDLKIQTLKAIYNESGMTNLFTDKNGYVVFAADGKKSLVNYVGTDSELVIPDDITEINDNAFRRLNEIRSIVIPDSVERIGVDAFYGCKSLINLTIGKNVKYIHKSAFDGCFRLVEIYNKSSLNFEKISSKGIVKNVYTPTSGSSKLFYDANDFIVYSDGDSNILVGYLGVNKDIIVPENITVINRAAFYHKDIEKISLPASIKRIEEIQAKSTNYDVYYSGDIMSWCNIDFDSDSIFAGGNFYVKNKLVTHLEIPEGVIEIPDYAFAMCDSIDSVTLPKSLIRIGACAFKSCANLTHVKFSKGLQIIDYQAFFACKKLENVVLPDGVKKLGVSVFGRCPKLESVVLP